MLGSTGWVGVASPRLLIYLDIAIGRLSLAKFVAGLRTKFQPIAINEGSISSTGTYTRANILIIRNGKGEEQSEVCLLGCATGACMEVQLRVYMLHNKHQCTGRAFVQTGDTASMFHNMQ